MTPALRLHLLTATDAQREADLQLPQPVFTHHTEKEPVSLEWQQTPGSDVGQSLAKAWALP